MPLFPTSPKALALSTWRDIQRPQYIAKITQDQRKTQALRNAETGQTDPIVVKNCLIYNLPTSP